MTAILVDKPIDLALLDQELTAAGVVHQALGTVGGYLYTYTAQGQPTQLPASAVAVYTAHVPPPPPPIPDYGTDDMPRTQLAQTVADLRAYLVLTAPTNAQTVAAFRLTLRVLFFVLKRVFT
jgi:hypothetical protein